MNRVCSSCFADEDLRAWIRNEGGRRGCCACSRFDSPTADFDKLTQRIEECIRRYYGRAVDQLGYCSAEGGYLGQHWGSWDMLAKIDLILPRDHNGRLFNAIAYSMVDEEWCDYDVGGLDLDDALRSSWERFCETVKHERRFFFHATGHDDRDSLTPASLLSHIAGVSENIGLIQEIPVGTSLWRARTDLKKGKRFGATDFGPPPVEYALQSNRMNPAGIPMLYLASTIATALKETRAVKAKVGRWRTSRPLRVLDLRTLPPVPSIFSDVYRAQRLTVSFLHSFATDIMKPVERDQRVHVDYLPSQVVTEFVRDYEFQDGTVDGIAYASTVHPHGWNIALFLGPVDLGLEEPSWGPKPSPSLTFEGDRWATSA
ncbi:MULTISPECIES: HEPN-associated N-terminal domain-containing protein [unclassified Paraburkholderia]|uniref:HEPN-associated N-terminal domain-containing protein n=1 Tax=unclassified Paraburkholderia TaxID=2615204 RepID=UPI002AB1D3FF|nr:MULTISPECIES: HEPN-associated N-terminal domain-containing protein [unclassified Paraburkholderia]